MSAHIVCLASAPQPALSSTAPNSRLIGGPTDINRQTQVSPLAISLSYRLWPRHRLPAGVHQKASRGHQTLPNTPPSPLKYKTQSPEELRAQEVELVAIWTFLGWFDWLQQVDGPQKQGILGSPDSFQTSPHSQHQKAV